MKFRLVAVADPRLLEPLTCGRAWADCPVAGTTLAGALRTRLLLNGEEGGRLTLACADALWPSTVLAAQLREAGEGCVVSGPDGAPLAWISVDGTIPAQPTQTVPLDNASRILRYPWDLLLVNEDVVGGLDHDDIRGTVRAGVTIDGHAVIGEDTVLLPGVYIEGNVIIGRDCKIGPNCYFRGSTSIGDNCHIGQAVEVKNSILMDRVGAGHLSYVGDSIVGTRSNLGAGTITANFRHDGKSHRSLARGVLVDTGRRKFGTILGDDVHTGIHTSIYPGRKIWPGLSTRPGEVVDRDRMEEPQGKAGK